MFGWRRCEIQLLTRQQTPDGYIEEWTTRETRWCRLAPVSAELQAAYQQLQAVVTHRLVFRGQVSLPVGDVRFVVGGKTYRPSRPALASGDGRFTAIEVEEVAA